ncbi:hypothetical protein H0266_03075 [Halobacillus locisalis]|uniref:Uncharacterized protein n=1 Tax=Halobacillus locisalis TaxID=220753 RepID=A0A838CQ42_9BACI|nr:hypothetical protein [Halobacillus locisalis]MBA2173875.1 hypothetical protein [Halobacillus locisalis]
MNAPRFGHLPKQSGQQMHDFRHLSAQSGQVILYIGHFLTIRTRTAIYRTFTQSIQTDVLLFINEWFD